MDYYKFVDYGVNEKQCSSITRPSPHRRTFIKDKVKEADRTTHQYVPIKEVFTDFPIKENFADFQDNDHDHQYYGIRIVTGSKPDSGTINPNVFLVLIGTHHRTEKIRITNECIFKRRLITSTYGDIIIEVDNEDGIGDVQAVWLQMDHISFLNASWYVEFVKVYRSNFESKIFPCYHWIKESEHITLTSLTSTLNDVRENDILVQERNRQLVLRKLKYQWEQHEHSGLPGFIDTSNQKLSLDEDFERVKNVHFTKDIKKSGKFLIGSILYELNHSLTVEDYRELAMKMKSESGDGEPAVPNWATDEDFGRLLLNGINPIVIEKCTSLPDNFPVKNDDVKNFLDQGKSLEQEMEDGHIFICNMKIMDGLQPRKYHASAAPICLLYTNNREQLIPIAIQARQGLREDDKTPNPIFFPNDSYCDWTLAKIYYQSAHLQIVTHFLCCHAVMEAYAMGTIRNLPDAHPIYKLLRPHFRFTMAINSRARATLIHDGGILDILFGIGGGGRIELMKRAYQSYSIHLTNIKRSVEKRGVDKIPGYYYRDDGFKIWDAIQEYATKVINRFYANDEDVASDPEIQKWAADIHHNGFPGYCGKESGVDFPNIFSNKADLIEHCTLIMFTGSAQHASVNFGQYDEYRYVPNAPLGVRKPPPIEKGRATEEDILDTLPNKFSTPLAIGLTYILSQYSEDEEFLGYDLKKYFVEDDVRGFIKEFQKKLSDISVEINLLNDTRRVKYTYMLPEKIPNSITI